MRLSRAWLLAAFALGIITPAVMYRVIVYIQTPPDFESQLTVSADQMKRIASAICQFEASHTRRPANMEELVGEKLLVEQDLFDADRRQLDGISPNTGRFRITPDVIYFPALRSADGPDFILLCTIATHKKGDKLLAVLNDGRLVEMTPHELTVALNRTYAFIGSRQEVPKPSTAPAAPAAPAD
jgi:hypothetical protein